MTGVEIAMAVVSAAATAAGTFMSGQASANASEYNAKLSRNNAVTARQQASTEAQDLREQNDRQSHTLHALYGASGLAAGSSLDVLADTAAQQELGVQRTLYKGELRAGEQLQKAELYDAQAKSQRTGSWLGAVGQLTGGLAKMGSGAGASLASMFSGASTPGAPLQLHPAG